MYGTYSLHHRISYSDIWFIGAIYGIYSNIGFIDPRMNQHTVYLYVGRQVRVSEARERSYLVSVHMPLTAHQSRLRKAATRPILVARLT